MEGRTSRPLPPLPGESRPAAPPKKPLPPLPTGKGGARRAQGRMRQADRLAEADQHSPTKKATSAKADCPLKKKKGECNLSRMTLKEYRPASEVVKVPVRNEETGKYEWVNETVPGDYEPRTFIVVPESKVAEVQAREKGAKVVASASVIGMVAAREELRVDEPVYVDVEVETSAGPCPGLAPNHPHITVSRPFASQTPPPPPGVMVQARHWMKKKWSSLRRKQYKPAVSGPLYGGPAVFDGRRRMTVHIWAEPFPDGRFKHTRGAFNKGVPPQIFEIGARSCGFVNEGDSVDQLTARLHVYPKSWYELTINIPALVDASL